MDVLEVLHWGKAFYRCADKETPKWVNDMVWDLCLPSLTHWPKKPGTGPSTLRFDFLQGPLRLEEDEEEYEDDGRRMITSQRMRSDWLGMRSDWFDGGRAPNDSQDEEHLGPDDEDEDTMQ